MTYETLDGDTIGIIDAMCFNTGKSKEEAILALVEIGMVAMVASVRPNDQNKIMQKIYDTINGDEKLKATAEAYKNYWDMNV